LQSSLLNIVKQDTKVIRDDTAAILEDTAQIPHIKQDAAQIASLVREIDLLRLQVSQLEDRGGSGGVLLERFLANSTSYAEFVVDVVDNEASQCKDQVGQDAKWEEEEMYFEATDEIEHKHGKSRPAPESKLAETPRTCGPDPEHPTCSKAHGNFDMPREGTSPVSRRTNLRKLGSSALRTSGRKRCSSNASIEAWQRKWKRT
jgi:hypothetical protein